MVTMSPLNIWKCTIMKKLTLSKEKAVIINFIVIIMVALILSVAGFFLITLRSRGREVLRNAKNVNLALMNAEIEQYGRGSRIFDPSKPDNLAEGVKQEVKNIAGVDGDFNLTSFDAAKGRVTGLSYFEDGFFASYEYDPQTGDHWSVSYLLKLLDFKE